MKIQQYITIVTLFIISQICIAQSHPYEVKFSHQIESELAQEIIRPSRAGLLYSLIGDYSNSIQYSDIPVSWGIDSLNLENYSTIDAIPIIVQEATKHQIVIISENHLKPQHRIFANQLITELSKIGFDHLGLETFTTISDNNSLLDSTLITRGYPLNSPLTGTYTLEPQMGNLVRNAINRNMNLFAYERTQRIEGKDRDEIQADNIIRYIENNPKSKLIIVCGFHHAIESDMVKYEDKYWMAKYLKDKLGIDPLTIYQDNFTEKQTENEHPILNSLKLTQPSIFVDETGEALKISDQVDFEIIHPKTTYINSRPDWLYNGGKRKSLKIDKESITLNYPLIVEVYPLNELNSVPLDRIELKHKYDNKVLVIEPGEYRIVMKDGEGEIEYKQTVE